MSSSTLPPVSELLSGYGFNDSPPGTPLNLTYYFETSVPEAGSWADDPTWTPFSAAEQIYVQQAMANVSAFANITFTQIYQTAEINYGNSTSSNQELMGTSFGKTQLPTPENPVAYTAFNGADFTPTPYYPTADNQYLATHELGNALGLLDYYGPVVPWNIPAQYTNSDYTTMAGVNFNTSHNAPPGYENPVGFQLLDIEALQYLYGVNENGYTPSYQNTTATLTGSNLTYSITDNSADETIWVGSNVASVKCLDFSACSSSVAVNLNAGTFSSNYVGPAIYSSYAAGPNDSIAIALNTVINVGISNNQVSTLVADSTPGSNDVLLGGTANDSFTAGAGEDIFIGGGGIDTAIFHDAAADYSIVSLGAGVLVVTDNAPVPTDGTLVLDGNFTNLQFADQTVTEYGNFRPSALTDIVSAPTAIISANQDALDYLSEEGKISLAVACYCQGTRLKTDRGDVAVERLGVGDLLVTASGEARPVCWIGHRRIDSGKHPNPLDVWPVRVCAGSFGDGIPQRDIWLSPDHAVFVEGVLIPIKHLINGATITQEPRKRVTYWHVELKRHDVILAEGLPCESYLDTGNREMFANGSVTALHPSFARTAEKAWTQNACAPLVDDGKILASVQANLAVRATQIGKPVSIDPSIDIDGAGLVCVVVPAGAEIIRLVSMSCREGDDRRRLGALVRGVRVDGAAVALHDDRLGRGFHEVEVHGGQTVRWTNGSASLSLGRGADDRIVEIDVAAVVAVPAEQLLA